MSSKKLETLLEERLQISLAEISQFCEKWYIAELALFGSVLGDRFNANSDIDILLSFQPNSRQGLLTLAKIKHELELLVCRDVDIALKQAILKSDNRIRRQEILQTAQILYAKGSSIAYCYSQCSLSCSCFC